MKTINRTLLIVIPKKPYIDWANSLEINDDGSDTGAEHYSAYLIPEKYNEYNYKEYLKDLIAEIFSPEILFAQTSDLKKCDFCPYAGMCNR